MSVYRPKGKKVWKYDFWVAGKRYVGSTGQIDRAAAKTVESEERLTARFGAPIPKKEIGLEDACTRWWHEKGAGLKSCATLAVRLEILLRCIPPTTLLSEIDDEVVSSAITTRRALGVHKRKKKDKTITPGRAPKNATLNRDILDTLRPVMRRAQKVWKCAVCEVDWKEHRQKEPRERVREFVADEMQRINDALAPRWQIFWRIKSRYGMRLAEMFFDPADLDVGARRLKLRDRKGGDDHTIPLLPEDAAMLAALKGRAQSANIKTLWYREMKSGELYPLSPRAAQSAILAGFKRAGIQDARVHDARHHAATQILRASKNLRAAQRLLGHESIQSTVKYAHVTLDDVEAGLAAAYTPSPIPVPIAPENIKQFSAKKATE